MVVGALIVKHVEDLSDEKTIQVIRENPYMQYLLGLPCFTEKPVFVPELFVLIRKLEKPRAFDPRGRVVLTPSGEIALTLCVEIKMTPEKQTFFRGFL